MDTNANIPKKYIRTFASDMAIVEKGGTPDLAPLVEPNPSPAERLMPSPLVSAPIPVHIPIPVTKVETPPPPAPLPPPEPKPEPEPEPAPTPKKFEKPLSLETYASDFSDRMKDTHASTATVLAAEQDAATQSPQTPQKSSYHNLLSIFVGVLLLIAGGFGVYAAYLHNVNTSPPATLAPIVSSPIFVEDREQIAGTGPVLLEAIEKSVSRPLSSGTVRFLYTGNATDSTSSPQMTTHDSIFSALQFPAPDILLRNLNASGSMAGIINSNGIQSVFFILSVDSYGETFSGMLSWEGVMQRNLGILFPAYPISVPTTSIATSTLATSTPKTAKKTTATTTATSSPPVVFVGFRDEVINNHDTRVYRDAERRSILIYGYWNQKTLVIARDPAAFTEILNRLASARTQP